MSDLAELLGLAAVQRAGLGLVLGAIALPPVGVVIVGLDIYPVRFAIMHVALLGAAVGMLTGTDPVLWALGLCAAAGGGLAPFATRPGGLSGAMGLLMSLAIAVALLVLSVSGVNANGAFELLWGSILSTRVVDLWVLGVLAVGVPALFWWRRHDLALLLHDRELAVASGVRAGPLTVALLVVVAVAIAGAVKLTGALLVDALTLLPALAARRIGRGLTGMVVASVVIGLGVAVVGLSLALVLDQPPGPILVLVAGVVALLAQAVRRGEA
ncbi:zinc transport system permease protein [Actinokineospora baliensis]|uniref:metal ABC transporter permease n=1 Tax=Actinokineospora baliensis TaxID=547056 RepID=UPI0019585E81|nr:metal ABC transporter permease [Actinokineospora baliensis]MBM7775536.1 zinc transport system permease protein [Actinokineospora baliensis]